MKSTSTISTREMRGYFIVLLIFTGVNLFGPDVLDMISTPQPPQFVLEQIISSDPDSSYKQNRTPGDTCFEPTPFNINAVTLNSLLKMGVEKQAASTWIKYREAIGGFERISQLKDIYGLKGKTLDKIKPYAFVESRAETPREEQNVHSNGNSKADHSTQLTSSESVDSNSSYYDNASYNHIRRTEKIDLNSATPQELIELPGIGPVFSQRIVKFRDLLGGFHSISQLSETYGLPSETVERIRDHLTLSTDWNRLDLNKVTENSLASHPYISWDTAGLIVRYREQNGPFESVDELVKLHGLPGDVLAKMRPYLTVVRLNQSMAIGDSLNMD